MKNMIIVLFTGLILAGTAPVCLHAQSILPGISNEEFTHSTDEFINKQNLKVSEINIKAVRNFQKTFKSARDIHWFKAKVGFLVAFQQHYEKIVCGYNKEGNWLYSFASYPEEKLPKPLWHRVRQAYGDFSISWINRVQTVSKTIFIVHLESNDAFKNVRIDDREMSEIVATDKL
jgi:hypothetical protein